MDESDRAVADAFRRYFDQVVQQAGARAGGIPLADALAEHLGVDPATLPVVSLPVPAHQLVNLDLALTELSGAEGGATLLGVGGGQQRQHSSLSEVLDGSRRWRQFDVAPVDYESLPTGADTTRQCVAFGIRVFAYRGAQVAVLQRGSARQFGRESAMAEVISTDPDVVSSLLEDVQRLMVELSVFRGQVLTLGGSEYEPGVGGITFHRRPHLTDAEIVMPSGLLDRVVRHAAGVGRHRDALVRAGQHLKRGLLLYGAPGTGKTLTIRYLLGAMPEATVVLLTGSSIRFVREATEMARALQPAVVVLEDCDLVAEDRTMHHGPQPLLFEVLDSLDGLAEDADVAFVLTSNRVDLLEPALAQRPGRVDLAVEVPLPDEAARRALVRLYGRRLPFTDAVLDRCAERSAGTTASFAKELVRRAVLVAAEAGHDVGDVDLEAALDELLDDREALTRTLLGAGEAGAPVGDGVVRPHAFGWSAHPGAAYGSSLRVELDG